MKKLKKLSRRVILLSHIYIYNDICPLSSQQGGGRVGGVVWRMKTRVVHLGGLTRGNRLTWLLYTEIATTSAT